MEAPPTVIYSSYSDWLVDSLWECCITVFAYLVWSDQHDLPVLNTGRRKMCVCVCVLFFIFYYNGRVIPY